jgi:hypothetical protein
MLISRCRPRSLSNHADRTKGDLEHCHSSNEEGSDAFVVFVDHTDCLWLRWLKPGFRHCFAAFRTGDVWVVCDPLKDRIELLPVDLTALAGDFDLSAFYAQQGHVVLVGKAVAKQTPRRPTIEPLTCVAVTKRVLGLRSSWIFTPWHLFCFLAGRPLGGTSWRLVSRHPEAAEVNFQLDI